jgi:hypothetical protein
MKRNSSAFWDRNRKEVKMKRFSWLLTSLVALCLIATTLAGCGAECQFRDFSSYEEFSQWLQANDVSEQPISDYASEWYSKALQVQEAALSDGYIVSAAYRYDTATDTYSVYCLTIIEGDIWYWDPETDEPYADYSLGKVK